MTKLNFYTEPVQDPKMGKWVGRCKQYPLVQYVSNTTRDAALSGVKRAVKRFLSGKLHVGPVNTPPPGPVLPSKPKVNRIVFVFDRSGSMASLISDAVKALNSSVQTIQNEARKTGQETYISLVIFDDIIEFLYTNLPASTFPTVRESDVRARNSTALLDATMAGIETIQNSVPRYDTNDNSFLVMVLTDGAENASERVNKTLLASEMQKLTSTDRWTFTFLVPPGHRNYAVSHLGVPNGNVMEWEQSSRGVQEYSIAQNVGISNYYTARASGQNSTRAFYTDLSGLKTKDLQKNLVDLSVNVKVLPVEKEVDIKTFVETKLGRPYQPGSAFYQLTKDEKKVQKYKELLVMEKGKKAVYGGPDARTVLGIPQGQDLKVKPGNHGNFDIFVQSTSLNRKLVRGTKVLVRV